MASIDGEIPPIESKNMKRGEFALHNRKTSPYLPRNELHSVSNRKISAYFTSAVYLIKDMTSYLNGSEMKTNTRRIC
ncbi:hypothetical protein [Bacillus sp. X1(2014)]|uniref:hypothetical protein n=1 Tax=Bacillus sp. X1(2014) TaxID=1565991 RepID=UPI001C92D83B|nr:hypothetical protein [Bacillus sp. X1(2014)]